MTLAYGTAAILFALSLYRPRLRPAAFVATSLGFIFNTLALGGQVLALHRLPLVNLFESILLLAWVSVLLYLGFSRGQRVGVVGTFLLPVVAFVGLVAIFLPRGGPGLPPILQSPWLFFHASSGLLAYGAFSLGCILSGTYLLQESQLRRKRFYIFYHRLPPLEVLEQSSYRLNVAGFLALTLSIVFGALWAETAWGAYWQWDPKQTWSLITWLFYAGYLHARNLSGWKGRRAMYLAGLGFLSAIINITIVPWFFRSIHLFPY